MGDVPSVFWFFDDGTGERHCSVPCDDGDFRGACEARDQLFHDEYGVKPEYSEHDAVFEIVAVPDDVAEDRPAPGCVVVLIADREPVLRSERPDEYPEPRRIR